MKEAIRGESYILRGDQMIPVQSLPQKDRERLANWLKETYLNELYRGRAVIERENQLMCKTEKSPLPQYKQTETAGQTGDFKP